MRLLIAFSIVCWSGNVYAYLDPGTGSLIIQSAIAIIAGAFVTIRLYWYQLKAWVGKITGRQPPDPEEEERTDI